MIDLTAESPKKNILPDSNRKRKRLNSSSKDDSNVETKPVALVKCYDDDVNLPYGVCENCGGKITKRTAFTKANSGRKFFCCPNRKCFFRWAM